MLVVRAGWCRRARSPPRAAPDIARGVSRRRHWSGVRLTSKTSADASEPHPARRTAGQSAQPRRQESPLAQLHDFSSFRLVRHFGRAPLSGYSKSTGDRTGERQATGIGKLCSPQRKRGDGEAYRAFLQAILPYRPGDGAAPSRRREAVEDVVQDALLTLHRVRHTYQPGRPVEPWLAAIVNRRAIDAARRRGRIGAREVSDDAAFETFADPDGEPQ